MNIVADPVARETLADAIVAAIRSGLERMWLYFTPSGDVGISLSPDPMHAPFSLVGNYDNAATRQRIIDDIIALQREPIA